MSENKDNKLTLINEKTANDYLTHTSDLKNLTFSPHFANINIEIGTTDKRLVQIHVSYEK